MITKVVNVDLHQPIYEKLTAKQGDIASRFILFHLLDGDTPFDLTGKSVRVYARKPDKTEIFNDLIINNETKGYCTLELTSQCLASAGVVKMELYISESGKILTSIPFDLEVISCINNANFIVSTNEFSALNEALASVQGFDNLKKEIVEARKTHGTVGNRLNNVDLRLDINAQQIQLLAPKDSLTKLENEKANKDDVQRLIASLASGGPRGVYETLDELKSAFPTGIHHIYITKDNNNWNYWNGSEWVAGGAFQTQTVREKSIGDIELNVTYKTGKLISGGINFNFTADILEIASGTIISDYTAFYSVANTENVLMTSDGFPRYVFLNTETRLLHVEARWFGYNPKELLICCYYNNQVYFVSHNDLITVNGKKLPITKENLHFSFTHGCVIQGDITFDLENKKFNIASSTVISDLTGFYSANNSGQEIIFTNNLATPVYLYFNTSTRLVHLEDRWFSYDADELLLCSIYQNKVHNSISKNFITVKNAFSFKGKKFVSYGDSITQGNTWQNYVVNELGVSHTNLGLSSSCISSFDTWAVSMSDDTRINGIPEDTDILTIMGGTNDWASRISIGTIDDDTRDTFIGGYKYLIEKVMQRIPNARIILMTPPFGYYNSGVGTGEINGVGTKLIEYINAVKSVAEYYKLPLINMYQDLGINKFNKDSFLIDEDVQVHPNSNGGKRIAGLVIGTFEKIKN